MKHLLYLVHRLPYPPNKGDKIASFNLLKYLSKHYHIHLGTFVDEPEDWQYVDKLNDYCADTCIQPLHPRRARIRSLRALLTGEPLSLPYYYDARLQKWVDTVLREIKPDALICFSGPMAQYVPDPQQRSILDLVDVDSEKFRSYAQESSWPLSWLYRREADTLLAHERTMAGQYDYSLFVSEAEAELFKRLAPEVADKTHYRIQGVDSNFFDPVLTLENPYPPDQQPLVFIGAMDYRPNIDAVVWFCNEVLPLIQDKRPNTTFYIVGMKPTEEVQKLADRKGVVVTGRVADVRPYSAHAAAAVAPLRIARGIQNKVLEAMAMGKELVATPEAMMGIMPCPGFTPTVTSDPIVMARSLIELLGRSDAPENNARDCVIKHYDWQNNLKKVGALLK